VAEAAPEPPPPPVFAAHWANEGHGPLPPPADPDAPPAGAELVTTDGPRAEGDEEHICHICRKVFKREMNLVFHMTTHRPKQPKQELEPDGSEPISCQDCGKMFGTKYQAKKHYLRRHFQGERPFACGKCGKRFVVREDLTMHAKSCGNVYTCGSCNVRLCSLGALKRHCKHFGHTALSLEPVQDVRRPDGGAPVDHHAPQRFSPAAGAPNGFVPPLVPAGAVLSAPNEAAAQMFVSQLIAQSHAGGRPCPHPAVATLTTPPGGAPAPAPPFPPAVLAASLPPSATDAGARALDWLRADGMNAACLAAQTLVSSSARLS